MGTVVRRAVKGPVLIIIAVLALILAMAGQAVTGNKAAAAPPSSPVDQTKVPHYFGPYPNWALSPLTLPKATVEITGGGGSGATAMATVDPTGLNGIQSIAVSTPGGGYTSPPDVTIGGLGAGATAHATIADSSVVTGFTNVVPGAAYKSFSVELTGGSPSTPATAIASGSVDDINLISAGSGYTMPTVDIDMPDAPDGVQAKASATLGANGSIDTITVTDPGSGYLTAPGITIRNGTQYDPIQMLDGGVVADADSTLKLSAVNVVNVGAGYTAAPTVTITDPDGSGAGAGADAVLQLGAVTGIVVDTPGSGYLEKGMRKFVDDLPKPCYPHIAPTDPGGCPEGDPAAKYLPLAEPEQRDYNGIMADEIVIGLVQYRTKFSSDLPGTLVRGYVQIETPDNATYSEHYPLTNELVDGTQVPITMGGQPVLGVTSPQYLGPIIAATKDKPVRVVFHNFLPTGADGDLFIPVDSTLMGSGTAPGTNVPAPVNDGTVIDTVRNPECTEYPKPDGCFKDDRATLHLHGGISPWISDGTPHQWITPAGENTAWPQGVSVRNVPDMNVCTADDDGCMTFYYTNQQSARMMFYHDHAWGITRLNVYVGEAAGYLITDDTEKKLIGNGLGGTKTGVIPGPDATLPLVVQDRTFVPGAAQLAEQDPTWDSSRWGGEGNFWFHHVYMPAQNPGDPSGMSAYGRWMYGPWFWPPAANTVYGPIKNPYYNKDPNTGFATDLAHPCNIDDPTTWQYQTDPFCEPEYIPGTPNISTGMEQFNDTPLVNGVAYPKTNLEPKTYRFRVLNASNDRFFNFQWYQPDPTQGSGDTEVALNPLELAAAQTDPNVFPTPVQNASTVGPDWVQIGTEGGFLPSPVEIDGQQPTTWITDPTRFDVGNVDKHSLLVAPAERVDVIVDFSKYAGKDLILYNDAPAAFPARVPSYDYYTGAPDLSPNGAPAIVPGYGPNTRTVMRVHIDNGPPAAAFSVTKLRSAFNHKSNGSGVFESGQPPIIVGQKAYNTSYGTAFIGSGNCNAAGTTRKTCDGFVRIDDTATFGFNTLKKQTEKSVMPLQPKAIHDEMNSTTFDEFGRMQATLGIEAQPPTPGLQNVTLYPFVNPQTELIDGSKLPSAPVAYDSNGDPIPQLEIKPIADTEDGSQIWRITHNGVDTHPIHFHLYDVQLINRVTWDNIIIPPDDNELGWKDTVRISPLEDTIVALRPIMPTLPWELPNSIRSLNPMDSLGSTALFNNIAPNGTPLVTPITNQLVNFGWEYVYHCHILTHEEMDMMRPVSVAYPPKKPTNVTFTKVLTGGNNRLKISFTDNSIAETSYEVQRWDADQSQWYLVGNVITQPLDATNTAGTTLDVTDMTSNPNQNYSYRVVAKNRVGYGGDFPVVTAESKTNADYVVPAVVSSVTPNFGTASGGTSVTISGQYFAPGATVTIGGSPATSVVVVNDTTITAKTPAHALGKVDVVVTNPGAAAGTLTQGFSYATVPGAPTGVTATAAGAGKIQVSWVAPASDGGAAITGYRVDRTTDGNTWTTVVNNTGVVTTLSVSNLTAGVPYAFRVFARNGMGQSSASTTSNYVTLSGPPGSPTSVQAVAGARNAALTWTAPASNGGSPITGYMIQYSVNAGSTWTTAVTNTGMTSTSFTVSNLTAGTSYIFAVSARTAFGVSTASAPSNAVVPYWVPGAPTNLAGTAGVQRVTLTWSTPASDGGSPITGYRVEYSTNGGSTWTTAVNNSGLVNTVSITGLFTGQNYRFRVSARNAAGLSSPSSPTGDIKPL